MARAFLLGAGATYADCQEKGILDNNFFNRLRDFSDLYKVVDESLDLSKKIGDCGLEEVLMEIESEEYRFEAPRIRECINAGLYRLLASITKSDRGFDLVFRDLEVPSLHKELLRFVEPDDFFITLNYDLMLDMAIWKKRGRRRDKTSWIDYGIEGTHSAKGIQPDEHLIISNENPEFSVYHLHGALNWLLTRDNTIEVYGRAIPPYESVEGRTPYIVPPGNKPQKKDEFPPVLEKIWDTAERRLAEVDELIIIGCSLSDHDTRLRDLVKSWYDGCKSPSVKIIDKSPETEYAGGRVNYSQLEEIKNASTEHFSRYLDIFKKFGSMSSGFNLDSFRMIFGEPL